MNKNNYAKIKAEYVTSDISLRELAEKYNLNLSALQKQSAKGKWRDERKKNIEKKAEKVAEKLNDESIKQTVKDINRVVKATQKLITKADKAIDELGKDLDYNTRVTTSEIIENEELKDEENGKEILKSKRTVKTRRKTTAKPFDSFIDTRKLADISKSLLNIKQILADENNEDDNEIGIVEIPQQIIPVPPEEVS